MAKLGLFVIQIGKFHRSYETAREIRCRKEGVYATSDVGTSARKNIAIFLNMTSCSVLYRHPSANHGEIQGAIAPILQKFSH